MKSLSRKTVLLLALFASVGILSSCTTTPERVEHTEVVTKNDKLRTDYKRISAVIEADCIEGLCTIIEGNLDKLVALINNLQDQIETRAEAHNKLVDSLNAEEMSKHREREARQYCEQAAKQDKIINTAKSGLQLLVCAGGILWGN